MPKMSRPVWSKYGVFFGAFLSGAATGIPLFYGNMLVYTSSYLHVHGGGQSVSSSPWLISVFFATHSLAFVISGPVFQCLGTHGGYCVGMLTCFCGAVSSYWSVHLSAAMLTITFGGLQGLGAGLVRASSLLFSLDWASSHRSGTVIAFTSCGVAGGAVGINFWITQFVNPWNLKPDVVDGPTAYFSQERVLERVPFMFPLLAGLIFITQFLGALLMTAPFVLKKGDNVVLVKSITSTSSVVPEKQEHRDSATPGNCVSGLSQKQILRQSSVSDDEGTFSASGLSENGDNVVQGNPLSGKIDLLPPSLETSENNVVSQFTVKTGKAAALTQNEVPTNCPSSDEDENKTKLPHVDSSPVMMLKSKFFYILLVTVSISEFTFIVNSNYYKQFAQIYVEDDHFLTNVAMGVVVVNIVGKVVWGRVLDSCTPATGLVLLNSLQCTCITLWYFAPSLGKAVLCSWALILSAVNSGTPVMVTVGVLRTYGRTFLPSNVGVLSCASALGNLMGPPLAKMVLYRYGWFQLFFTAGCLNCCGVLITVAYYVIGTRVKGSRL